jgi:hypothetical protein
MKASLNKELLLGVIIGVISPLLFLPLLVYVMSISDGYSFSVLWEQLLSNSMDSSKYISLALISNLFWFYFFLNREKYYQTRGIILGMICYAPYMVYIYYFQ